MSKCLEGFMLDLSLGVVIAHGNTVYRNDPLHSMEGRSFGYSTGHNKGLECHALGCHLCCERVNGICLSFVCVCVCLHTP